MNLALWKKCLSESAMLFVGCAIGTIGFAWFRVHVVGELDTTSFQKILDLLPKDWLNFTTVDVNWLVSYVGRTAMTLDEPFLVMMIAIWAIVRGSDVVSGEISRGTMEMLLAQPVSRNRVFVIHCAVTAIGVTLLVLLTWLAMSVGVYTTDVKVSQPGLWGPSEVIKQPMSQHVNPWVFAPGLLNLLLLGFFVSALAVFFSAFDRYRWRTLGIVGAIYMAAAMIKILGMASESFRWTGWLTFFSWYEPESAIKLYQIDSSSLWQFSTYDENQLWEGFGPMGHNALLLGSAAVLFASAIVIFRRRDISAPL